MMIREPKIPNVGDRIRSGFALIGYLLCLLAPIDRRDPK
jgi:hypothetical protein